MPPRHRLITVPFSHYCEKARWALERYGVTYREEGHLPVLHYTATLPAGGGRTVPVLVSPHGVLRDSTAILRYADAHGARAAPLYPHDADERREVEALEDVFDETLGPDTRRIIYFHLLRDRAFALGFLRAAPFVPRLELSLFAAAYPLVRRFMTKRMTLTAPSVEASLARVRATFDDVAKRLAGGRRFLVGDAFSAADLTFASLAAPVLAPREYGVPLPELDDVPPDAAALMRSFRDTPAGAFALRLFRDHRREIIGPAR